MIFKSCSTPKRHAELVSTSIVQLRRIFKDKWTLERQPPKVKQVQGDAVSE